MRRSGWPGRPGRSQPGSPAGSPGVQLCADHRAGRCREPGRSRARRGGGPGPGPGRGRPDEPGEPAAQARGPRLAGGPGPATPPRTCGKDSRLAGPTGTWFELPTGLSQCGSLCAATGRAAEALTLWAACAAVDRHLGGTDPPWLETRQEEQLRQARPALGPDRARAAEDRGAAMSIATAAEYALMLTDPGPSQPAVPDSGHSQRPGTGAGHPGRPGPHQRPYRRGSCISAPARSARTWTGSGTRPAAAAAPT